MRLITCLTGIMVAVGVTTFAAADGATNMTGTLVQRTDGGWETRGLPYTARISSQGYIEAIEAAGFNFMAPTTNAARGLFLADGESRKPFTSARLVDDALVLDGPQAQLTLRCLPARLEITVNNQGIADGHCVRMELSRGVARVKGLETGDEFPVTAPLVSGRARLIATNGASLTLPGQYLMQGGGGYVVKMPAVMPRGPETTLRVDIAPAPLIEDSVQVVCRATTDDFTYWTSEPRPFTTVVTNMLPDQAVKGDLVLRLKPYLTKTVAREMHKRVSLARGDADTFTWTLEQLDPSLYIAEIWLERGDERGLCATSRFVFHAGGLKPPPAPKDFDAFWQRTLEEQAKIPLDLQLTKVKDQGKSEVYKFSFAGMLGHRCYGYLTVPQDKSRKYPAVLVVPSSGVHTLQPPTFPNDDRVGMAINIALVDVDLPPEQYDWRTWPAPYLVTGILDRDYYTLRFSYAATARAAEVLAARPEVQADDILLVGSSQGGGLAFVAAALYPKFKATVANVPGLCRLDWNLDLQPPYFPVAFTADGRPAIAKTLSYYDAVQFAARVKCPIWVSLGLFDDVTPSMGVFCAYNAIPSPQKQLLVQPKIGHGGGWDSVVATKGVWP